MRADPKLLSPLMELQMDLVCQFVVPGAPQPKERPRLGKRVITPDATKSWEQTAAYVARLAMGDRSLLTGPVHVEVAACFRAPDKLRKRVEATPLCYTGQKDIDNVAKTALDAMSSVVYRDDAQVASLSVSGLLWLEEYVLVSVYTIDQPLSKSAASQWNAWHNRKRFKTYPNYAGFCDLSTDLLNRSAAKSLRILDERDRRRRAGGKQ